MSRRRGTDVHRLVLAVLLVRLVQLIASLFQIEVHVLNQSWQFLIELIRFFVLGIFSEWIMQEFALKFLNLFTVIYFFRFGNLNCGL